MNPRAAEALDAMKALGISREEAEPVLKRLYMLYGKNWQFIEEENYRALVDAIFEAAEGKKEVSQENAEPVPKKSHLTPKEDNGSRKVNGSSCRVVKAAKPPSPSSSALEVGPSVTNLERKSEGLESSSDERNDQIVVSSSSSHVKRDSASANGRHSHRFDAASSKEGDVTLSFICDRLFDQSRASPIVDDVLQRVEAKFLRSDGTRRSASSLRNLLEALCECFSELRKTAIKRNEMKTSGHFIEDISKGTENVKISLVDETGEGDLPKFVYIPRNSIYLNAHVSTSLGRIPDDDSCPSCSGSCLAAPVPCACARETGGEFAYTPDGLLKEEFLESCMALKRNPPKESYVYCEDCPVERAKDEAMPEPCKGHLMRRFVKECWWKCGCQMSCGNRVVQRGIARKLEVFWTREGKGWGLRSKEDLPKGAFVCEYVGEIVTNMELHDRNMQNGKKRHTYPVCLDADWGSESILQDEEALCLDATNFGNVARFINHRCHDATLQDIPVEVETLDRHYYHLAFFTTRKVRAYEELTWMVCQDTPYISKVDYRITRSILTTEAIPLRLFDAIVEVSIVETKTLKRFLQVNHTGL